MCVWRKVKRSTMPEGRRCVKTRWVFNINKIEYFVQDL